MLKHIFATHYGSFAVRVVFANAAHWCIVGMACCAVPTFAQTSPAAPMVSTFGSSLSWEGLSQQQRESLHPLATTWDRLTEGQKRKWLAVAQNFTKLSQPEQEKIRNRMVEWAALKPKERELARLNFAETKKIAPTDRAANWEAYQTLTAEEKKELAQKARKKTPGAALAVKPVARDKLAIVPVTRLTPEPALEKQQMKHTIDRNTLLPVSRPPDDHTIESPFTQGPHRQ
jgi:hypothetical protein